MTNIVGLTSPATREDEQAPERAAQQLKRRARIKSTSLSLGVLAALLVLWQVVTTLNTSTYWPPPLRIIQRMADLWLPSMEHPVPQGFTADVVPSLVRMGIGLGLAILLGIVLGVALGLSKRFEGYTDWILQFFRAIPPPTLFPVFLLLFGVSDTMRVTLIAFGTVWPILLNTIEGVRSIPALTFESAVVFKISPVRRLFRIVLPAAAPKILAGIRMSFGLAIILMVISEMMATTNGIGFQLIQAQRTFLTLDMWAAIMLLGILGYVLNLILTGIERRVLLWQRLGGKETS